MRTVAGGPRPARPLRVYGVAADGAACGHLRVIYPLAALRQRGIDAVLHHPEHPLADASAMRDYPLLLLQRQIDETAHAAITAARARGQRVIYELDDDLWALPDSNPAYRLYHPGSPALDWVARCIAACDGVTTTTAPLAERLAAYNPNVAVVPNALDLSLGARDWTRSEPTVPGPTVGFTGGFSHWTEIPMLAALLRALFAHRPDVTFVLGGPEAYHAALLRAGLPPARIVYLGTRPFDRYPAMLGTYQVALAPLADNAFNRAKSDLRILEHGAMGVPVVASPVRPYADFDRRHPGLVPLARRIREWLDAIDSLLDDRRAYRKTAEALRTCVWDHYDLSLRAPDWTAAWRRLLRQGAD